MKRFARCTKNTVSKASLYSKSICPEVYHCAGPVVRINPREIHVDDADFYPELYAGSTQKRDKWTWALGMFGGGTSAFATAAHDHHRLRRAPLNPLFSRSSIRRIEPLIQSTAQQLCRNLDAALQSDACFDLGLAFTVFAADVVSAYCFGEPFGLLQNAQFAPEWLAIVAAPSELGHLIKQMPWLIGFLRWVPASVGQVINPAFARFYKLQEVRSAQPLRCEPLTYTQYLTFCL